MTLPISTHEKHLCCYYFKARPSQSCKTMTSPRKLDNLSCHQIGQDLAVSYLCHSERPGVLWYMRTWEMGAYLLLMSPSLRALYSLPGATRRSSHSHHYLPLHTSVVMMLWTFYFTHQEISCGLGCCNQAASVSLSPTGCWTIYVAGRGLWFIPLCAWGVGCWSVGSCGYNQLTKSKEELTFPPTRVMLLDRTHRLCTQSVFHCFMLLFLCKHAHF